MVTVRLWGVSMWRSEGEPGLAGRTVEVMVLVEEGDDCAGSGTLSAEKRNQNVHGTCTAFLPPHVHVYTSLSPSLLPSFLSIHRPSLPTPHIQTCTCTRCTSCLITSVKGTGCSQNWQGTISELTSPALGTSLGHV